MELINLKPMEEGEGSPDQAAEQSFAKETTAEPAGEWRTTAGYTSSMERCATCEYFQQESGTCSKYNGEVEEGGHCKSWEPMEADEEGAGAEEEEGDDMAELEELA